MTRKPHYESEQSFRATVSNFSNPHCYWADCSGLMHRTPTTIREFSRKKTEPGYSVRCPECGYVNPSVRREY